MLIGGLLLFAFVCAILEFFLVGLADVADINTVGGNIWNLLSVIQVFRAEGTFDLVTFVAGAIPAMFSVASWNYIALDVGMLGWIARGGLILLTSIAAFGVMQRVGFVATAALGIAGLLTSIFLGG